MQPYCGSDPSRALFSSNAAVKESMADNLLRLSSFSTFPSHINIFSSHFTKAGFYYTGISDTVKCYSCGVIHSNWTAGDKPLDIHQKLNPNCKHLLDIQTQNDIHKKSLLSNCYFGNISSSETNVDRDICYQEVYNVTSDISISQNSSCPQISDSLYADQIGSDTGNDIQNTHENESIHTLAIANRKHQTEIDIGDTRSNILTECVDSDSNSDSNTLPGNIRPSEINETNEACRSFYISHVGLERSRPVSSASNTAKTEEDVPNFGISLEKPKYQKYAPIQVRISSFQNWPGYLDQTPKMMATAGFFYAGYNDYTRCFFCGGGLRNWEAGDNPWIEHARWFPKCAYLIQNKDVKFIKIVQEKHRQVMVEQKYSANDGSIAQTQSTVAETQGTSGKNQYTSQNHLESAGARSAVDIGFPNVDILQAIEKLRIQNKDTVHLLEDNQQRRDQCLCKICLDLEASIAFLPCGHLVCCENCALAMRKCPMCRAGVKGTVKTVLV